MQGNDTKEKFKLIFDNSAVGITFLDNKERIISWNKYTEKLLGTKNLYLKPVKSLYPENEWKKLRSAHIRKQGMRHHFETRMKSRKGLIDVDISLSVLKDSAGKVTGSIGIIRDVTYRKQIEDALKESEHRYRTVFDNSAVAITLTDDKERIVSWNKFAEQLYCKTKKELYLKPVRSLYPKEEWLKMRKANIRQHGMRHHFETMIQCRKTGEYKDIDISLSVLRDADDRIIGSIGIARDITKRKQAERMLNQLYEEKKEWSKYLEIEVKKRTLDLQKANQQIKELFNAKNDFLNQVAHDLRTPLTPVTLLLGLIKKEIKMTPQVEEMWSTVERNIGSLTYLITDVFNYVNLETGKRKLTLVANDISKLISDKIKNKKSLFKKNNIKTTSKIQKVPKIYFDKTMVSEVLDNIISNAIEYMKSKKSRKLKFQVIKQYENVLVKITDTGRGIEKDKLDKIFNELYKVDQYQGGQNTGMGLSICKMIIEYHQGKIWAESAGVGKGTSVLFTLPLKTKRRRE